MFRYWPRHPEFSPIDVLKSYLGFAFLFIDVGQPRSLSPPSAGILPALFNSPCSSSAYLILSLDLFHRLAFTFKKIEALRSFVLVHLLRQRTSIQRAVRIWVRSENELILWFIAFPSLFKLVLPSKRISGLGICLIPFLLKCCEQCCYFVYAWSRFQGTKMQYVDLLHPLCLQRHFTFDHNRPHNQWCCSMLILICDRMRWHAYAESQDLFIPIKYFLFLHQLPLC